MKLTKLMQNREV